MHTVPEHENERITLTASASLNSHPLAKEPLVSAPIISPPIPPAPAPSAQDKKDASKQTSATSKKDEGKPTTTPKKEPEQKQGPTIPAPLPKQEELKPKQGSTTMTPLSKPDQPKPDVKEPAQPANESGSKPEGQGSRRKSFSSRLSDVGKNAGNTTAKDAGTSKENDGDKPTDNKEAKDAKDKTATKDAAGTLATGQNTNETPIGTPLLNQDPEQPGTPTTGQSVTIRFPVQH